MKASRRLLGYVAPSVITARYKAAISASPGLAEIDVLGLEQPRSLDGQYVPLHLIRCDARETAATEVGVVGTASVSSAARREYRKAPATIWDALLQSSTILVLGEPGSGKTTLMRRLALAVARGELTPEYVRRLTFTHQDDAMETLIPILVSLPRFAQSDSDLLSYVTVLFARLGLPQADAYLQRKLDAGQCLLLFDGLDQVGDRSQCRWVMAQIRALRQGSEKPNQIVVNARTVDHGPELDGFAPFEVLPFSYEDVEDFVTLWFSQDLQRAESLLATLEASRPMRSMAGNPGLLSVLTAGCETHGHPCLRSVDLLHTVVDILLGAGARPELKASAQRLAYVLQTRRQDAFSLEDAATAIQGGRSEGARGRAGQEVAHIRALARETGLLWRAPEGTYSFCHPTIRKYLAAREVFEREEVAALSEHIGDPWWRDLVVFAAGLQRDATALVSDVLARDEGGEAVVLAARCLREADKTKKALRRNTWSRLFELLDQEKPSLWASAAQAIASLEGKRTRDAFPDLLASEDSGVRAQAARAMSRICEGWAAPPLMAALADASPLVRQEAAAALGALGDERAIFPLVKLLDDEHSAVHGEAIRALGAIGEPALKPLIGAIGDRSDRVPPRAAKALGLVGEVAVPALLTALGSEREELREGAVVALAEIGPAAIEPLIGALESDSARVRRGAVAALGRSGDRKVMEHIVEGLGDLDEKVRKEATRTLVRLGAPAVGPVVAALVSANLRVSEGATDVLARMGQPAVDGLLQALGDEKRALRWAAVKALGVIGSHDPAVVSKLRRYLADGRPEVRQSAVRALGRIGSQGAVEALVGTIGCDDEAVRKEAADVLVRVGGDEVVRELRRAFSRHADPDVVIGLVGRIGNRAARDFLRELLEHDARAIRNMAAIALESDEKSGLYFYRAWEPRIEENLLALGTVTTAMLTGTPNGLRTVVLQRYVDSHQETDVSYDAEMGILRLNTFSRTQKVMEYWARAGQNLGDEAELAGRMFATHVEGLTRELCDMLEVTVSEAEHRGRLHSFALDVESIVKSTNLPSTIPLVFLRRQSLCGTDLDDLRSLLVDMNVYHRTVLLVLFGQGEEVGEARRLLDEKLRDVHAFDVIILGERDIQHIVTARDAQEALRFTICEQADLTLVSPYSFDEPASRTLFFGREFEIRTIIQAIPSSSVAVLGGRRIGKTSILHRVSDLLCGPHACYYMDCHPIRNYEVLFRTLGYRWPALGDLPPNPVSFHSVVAELRSDGPLILVLDEIDALLRFDIEHEELLFKTFRSLSQEGQCRFIFSGERVLSSQLRYGATSPLFNFCGQRIRLGYLETKSAEKLIVEPMSWMNIDLRDRDSVVGGILDLSSCHPRLVQYICHSLIKQINREGKRFISGRHLERIARSNELREEYLWTVWGDATPFEKVLTLTMDHTSATEDEMRATLRRWDIPYAWEDLRAALHNLQICSILERDDGTFRFVPEHFPRIARESLDIEMEISSLKRRIGREQDL